MPLSVSGGLFSSDEGGGGSGEQFEEERFESFDGEVSDESAVFGDGDDAGFFADDDDDGVGVFGEAEGGAVPGAEVLGQVAAFGEGELDASGGEFALSDDDAHIVEDGAGPKDGVEEFDGEVGVDGGAGIGEAAEADVAFDGDESADAVLGAVGGGACEDFDLVFDGVGSALEEACFAKANEGAAEFGLEDHDDGEGGEEEDAAVEEFDAIEAVAAEADDDVGDDEEERGALDEACAARAAHELDDEVDDDADEEEFQRDDPPGIRADAVEILCHAIGHYCSIRCCGSARQRFCWAGFIDSENKSVRLHGCDEI